MDANGNHSGISCRSALVLVTKVPLPGLSKTRLIPSLGPAGATAAAVAMLTDVVNIAKREELRHGVDFFINFAPPTERSRLESLLAECAAGSMWTLLPIECLEKDIRSENLSNILSATFLSLSSQYRIVSFIGSDTPNIETVDILKGIQLAAAGQAYITPAVDGGYTLLSLPGSLGSKAGLLFRDVRWSSADTYTDQVRRIEEIGGCQVHRGPCYLDIDSAEDVVSLVQHCQVLLDQGKDILCPVTFASLKGAV